MARINAHNGVMRAVLRELTDGEMLFLQGCIVHEVMDFSKLTTAHVCVFESVRFEKGFVVHHAGDCAMPHAILYDFECRYSACKTLTVHGVQVQEGFYIDDFVCENADFSHAVFCAHHQNALAQEAMFGAHTITCKNSLCFDGAVFYQCPCVWDVTARAFSAKNVRYAPYAQGADFRIARTDGEMLAIKTTKA